MWQQMYVNVVDILCFICVDIGYVVICACRDPKFMQDLLSQDSMQSVSYGRGEGGV